MELDPWIDLLIFVVLVGGIGYLIYWAVGKLVPEAPGRVIQVLVAVIFGIIILAQVAKTAGLV